MFKMIRNISTVAALGMLTLPACSKSSSANEPAMQAANTNATQKSPAPIDAESEAAKDIVDTAIAAGNFSTLVAAVQAAQLVDALKSDGPFTVFAPTDAAFAKLPAGTVEKLLEDPEALAKILKHHVVAGKVMSAQVVDMSSALTLNESTLSIDTSTGVKIGNAMVTTADIETSNGVIHVIDTVLIPQ